jgi:2-methylcitrate dehydratase PrpD
VKTLGGIAEACVPGTRIVTNVVNAALTGGMLAHADETDDTHALAVLHPGSGVVPAALAMAEREKAGGTALLRAVALGYDISVRLSLAMGAADFSAAGRDTHGFCCTFGAAAAAGSLASANDVQRMQDPKAAELRRRVELYGDDEMDRVRPVRQGIVELKLRDGRELRHRTTEVHGMAQNPMTREEIAEKCLGLCAPVLGTKHSRDLVENIWNIERVTSVRALRQLLQG